MPIAPAASARNGCDTPGGSDGGRLAAPMSHEAIEIAPGERFDVVVDFSAVAVGTEVTLANTFGAGPAGDVMRFRVVRAARDDGAVPSGQVSQATPSRSRSSLVE